MHIKVLNRWDISSPTMPQRVKPHSHLPTRGACGNAALVCQLTGQRKHARTLQVVIAVDTLRTCLLFCYKRGPTQPFSTARVRRLSKRFFCYFRRSKARTRVKLRKRSLARSMDRRTSDCTKCTPIVSASRHTLRRRSALWSRSIVGIGIRRGVDRCQSSCTHRLTSSMIASRY